MDTLLTWTYILVALGFYEISQYKENPIIDAVLWPYHVGVLIAEETYSF